MKLIVIISVFMLGSVFGEQAVSASSVSKVEVVSSGQNYTSYAANWRAQVDPFGSKVSFGSALVVKGVVSAQFTMAAQVSPADVPYVELMCGVSRALSPSDTIVVQYKSDVNVLIKLVQTDLGDEGNETYAYYEKELPATGKSFKKAVVVVSRFSQPTWAPEEAMFVPLRPENVAEIQIAPVLDEKRGGVASVSIQSLRVLDGPK